MLDVSGAFRRLSLLADDGLLLRRRGQNGRQVSVPGQARAPQVGEGGAVGAQRGRVPAGQRHIAQVGEAPEAVVAADQNLAAPDRAVRPQARPVEDDADGRLPGGTLCSAGSSLGARGGAARRRRLAAQGVARRQIVGVGVVGDDLRRDAEQALQWAMLCS